MYVYARDFDMEQPTVYPDILPSTASIVLQQNTDRTFPPQLGTHLHLSNVSRTTHGNAYSDDKNNNTNNNGGTKNRYHESCLALGMSPQDVVSNLGSPDYASLSPLQVEPFIHKYEYRKLGKTCLY